MKNDSLIGCINVQYITHKYNLLNVFGIIIYNMQLNILDKTIAN